MQEVAVDGRTLRIGREAPRKASRGRLFAYPDRRSYEKSDWRRTGEECMDELWLKYVTPTSDMREERGAGCLMCGIEVLQNARRTDE